MKSPKDSIFLACRTNPLSVADGFLQSLQCAFTFSCFFNASWGRKGREGRGREGGGMDSETWRVLIFISRSAALSQEREEGREEWGSTQRLKYLVLWLESSPLSDTFLDKFPLQVYQPISCVWFPSFCCSGLIVRYLELQFYCLHPLVKVRMFADCLLIA